MLTFYVGFLVAGYSHIRRLHIGHDVLWLKWKSVHRRQEVWSPIFRARRRSTCASSFIFLFQVCKKHVSPQSWILCALACNTGDLDPEEDCTSKIEALSYHDVKIERSSESLVLILLPSYRLPVTGREHPLSISEDSSSIPRPPNF